MVLLAVFICIGALVQGSLLQDFILDDGANMDDRQWIWNRYGTAYRALYTFYEITFVPRSPVCVTGQVGEVGQVASIHSCICPWTCLSKTFHLKLRHHRALKLAVASESGGNGVGVDHHF